jgi:hypothetical protein
MCPWWGFDGNSDDGGCITLVLLVSRSFAVGCETLSGTVSCEEATFWYGKDAGSEYTVTIKDDPLTSYTVSVVGGF